MKQLAKLSRVAAKLSKNQKHIQSFIHSHIEMNLQLKPHHTNTYPIGGILLKGHAVLQWLNDIQQMGFQLQELEAFPIPGTEPNSVWGCLLLLRKPIDKNVVGRHALCQQINHRLYIPENTLLYPYLSEQEFRQLFEECPHFFHPILGLVELKNPIQWSRFVVSPTEEKVSITQPKEGVYVPRNIYAFQVIGKTPEEALKDLEEQIFPQTDAELEAEPLSKKEKIQLKMLKNYFREEEGSQDSKNHKEPSFVLLKLLGIKKDQDTLKNMQSKLNDLERRNQKELDTLMDMFDKDPKNALKYAIPLDDGTARGKTQVYQEGAFSLGKRWRNFSLFGNSNYGTRRSGSAVLNDGSYDRLHRKYRETAANLINDGDYREAAFVYMKLLKDYYTAANTLVTGGYYEEAAVVYLKYSKNKEKAAWCYEQGKFYKKAIELYDELGNDVKVGDLLMEINKYEAAMERYEKVAANQIENNMYLAAFNIYVQKMNRLADGRKVLLQAWDKNYNAINCMNSYLDSFDDEKQLEKEIEQIYQEKVNAQNEEKYLNVMSRIYKKSNDSLVSVKNIAYEIISRKSAQNINVLSELKHFQRTDEVLKKDILRYKRNLRL